jgi:cytochrome P450
MGSFIWKTVRLYAALSYSRGELLTTFHRQIGNTWVMFFAGHETTASVLAATFCFLAGYQDEQDIVFEELQNLTRETVDGELGFDQYDSLLKTRSAFVEALRMFPAGALVIRETREDTILHVPAGTDEHGNMLEESVPVPKGTVLAGDMTGMRGSSAFPLV